MKPYVQITEKEIEDFLANPAHDLLHAEGTTYKSKRSHAWYSILLARTDKKTMTFKILKKAVKKTHDVLVFEHASFLARPGK
jgi:hypothetical protein